MRTKIPLILSVLMVTAAAWILSSRIPHTKYQGDENLWVASSHYYASLLMNGNFDKEAWEGRQYNDWGSSLNLHLGQYLLGIPIKLHLKDSPCPIQSKYIYHFIEPSDLSAISTDPRGLLNGLIASGYIRDDGKIEDSALGLSSPDQLNIGSKWENKKTEIYYAIKNAALNKSDEQKYQKNIQANNIVPNGILYPARAMTAIFGLLSLVLLILMSVYSQKIFAGSLAVFITINQPLFITMSTQAITDIHYIFFQLLICLASMLLPLPKRPVFSSIIIGILIGMATSVKIYAFVVSGIFLLIYLAYSVFARHLDGKKAVLSYITMFISSLITIYITNPNLYYSSYPGIFFQMFIDRMHMNEFHAKYVGMWSKPDHFMEICENIFSPPGTTAARPILLAGAIAANITMVITSIREKRFNPQLIPFLFFTTLYLYLICFLTLNWDRYYLPIMVVSNLIIAFFVCDVISYISNFLISSRNRAASS